MSAPQKATPQARPARPIAAFLTAEHLAEGAHCPRLTELRELSAKTARSVVASLRPAGLAPAVDESGEALEERVRASVFDPSHDG